MSCEHKLWEAKIIPMSNTRPTLREFCAKCGRSSGGSNLGFALPMTSDIDLKVPSFKYKDKTLGEIFAVDPEYLVWLVKESKSSDRIKKSAARIYKGRPYTSPTPGDIYPSEHNMNSALAFAGKAIEEIKNL